jgi:aquaporin Z
MKRYLVEGIGAFFLTLAVAITAYPLAIGLMFAAMIYFGGHISGGHFNPAISLSVFFRQKLSSKHLGWYIVSQTVGAFIAAELFFLIAQSPLSFPVQSEFLAGLVNEVLPTFVLCVVALEVLTCSRFKGAEEHGGLILGFTLAGIAHFPGIFNPAILLGVLVSGLVHAGDSGTMGSDLLYIAYPVVGALLAVFIFDYVNNDKPVYKEYHQ